MKDEYLKYKEYMLGQFSIVESFENYESFCKSVIDTTLGEEDFVRYKSKSLLSEIAFNNAVIDKKNIRKKVMKHISGDLNGS